MCVGPVVCQEYAYHYGALWLVSSSCLADRQDDFKKAEFSAFSAPLMWLLASRSIPLPAPQEQREQPYYRRIQHSCGAVCPIVASTEW